MRLAKHTPLQPKTLPQNVVPKEAQLQILKLAQEALRNGDRLAMLKGSLANCHEIGIYSILLLPNLRSFCTDSVLPGWDRFSNDQPHQHNSSFLLHKHRYDLTSLPLDGEQFNVIYEESDISQPSNEIDGLYQKSLFSSAILTGKLSHSPKNKVLLKRTSFTQNEPWFMKQEEIHRVVWATPIVSLVKEHREESAVDKKATEAYQLLDGTQCQCEKLCHSVDLYQPITQKDFDRLTKRIEQAVYKYIQQLE